MNIFERIFNIKKEEPVTKQGINLNRDRQYITSRVSQNVQKWRDAMAEAESLSHKYRVKMQNIYKDTILNGHVKACINKRKNITLQQEFNILNENGEINEEMTKLFNEKWFGDILSYILEAKFFGYSLINWTTLVNGLPSNIQLINRELTNPEYEYYNTQIYATQGKSLYDEELLDWSLYVPTVSDIGTTKCGFGALYDVAYYEIILRNLMSNNIDYSDKFGQPVIVATTSKIDDTEIDYLESSINNLGSSGYIIKDTMDEIEYLEYKGAGDGYNIYDNLEKRCESKISKILLGHADALDSTPGKLGSQTEISPAQIALNEIKKNDSDFLYYIVNDILIPKLQKLQLIDNNITFEFTNNQQEEITKQNNLDNLNKIANSIEKLSKAGYDIDIKWLEEYTNIPFSQRDTSEEKIENMFKKKLKL